jgi:hypothetical protein
MKIFKVILFTIPLVLISACSSNANEEFFCEYKKYGLNNDSSLYFQSTVKINDSEICIYHRGNDYCAEFGKSINGYVDNSDWDKNIKHSEIYSASREGQNYIFKVFDKNQLQVGVEVESALIKDEWHFTFNGKKLKPTLPSKYATDESLLIFKLAAIENQACAYVRCEFVSQPSPPKKFDNEFEEKIHNWFPDQEVIFTYGNDKYQEIKNLVNGTSLGQTYTFNKNNMILIYASSHPIKSAGYDGIYRYQCEEWKKQKWYEFP